MYKKRIQIQKKNQETGSKKTISYLFHEIKYTFIKPDHKISFIFRKKFKGLTFICKIH